MGAAGDMLTAALADLLPLDERKLFEEEFNSLGIPDVSMSLSPSEKCGVSGTYAGIKVKGAEEGDHDHSKSEDGSDHGHKHYHNRPVDIERIFTGISGLSDRVKNDILGIYRIIADAESAVHGVPVTEVHFHEVGAMDAVADITAVCMLIDKIAPDRITASPVNTGSGHVHCAHGILPVPAPATAAILADIPSYSNGIESELCTPTGAALLKYFAGEFGEMPEMTVEACGCGMGKKDFETANCVRIYLGEMNEAEEA